MKSVDGGGNWTDISSSLGPTPHTTVNVGAFAIDPQTPATLYAGIYFSPPIGPCSGVFKSIDGGGSWGAVSSSSFCPVSVIAIDPQMSTTLYAVTDSKVFKTSNGGESWSAANIGLANTNVRALAIDAQTPANLYAGTGDGVFKSSDGGGSWTAINSGLTNTDVEALVIDPQNPSRIYAGTRGGGVFVTSVDDCSNSISPLNQSYSAVDSAVTM